MLTSFGRALRKIRIDQGEILKDMANTLGVTSSYLSAVENGKRAIPESWEEIILTEYQLDNEQERTLRQAVIESIDSIRMNVADEPFAKKEVAFAFARMVADLPEDKLTEIKKILGGE